MSTCQNKLKQSLSVIFITIIVIGFFLRCTQKENASTSGGKAVSETSENMAAEIELLPEKRTYFPSEADSGIFLLEVGQSPSAANAELLNPEIIRKVLKDGESLLEIGQGGNPYPTEEWLLRFNFNQLQDWESLAVEIETATPVFL